MNSNIGPLGEWELQRRTALAEFLRDAGIGDADIDIDPVSLLVEPIGMESIRVQCILTDGRVRSG